MERIVWYTGGYDLSIKTRLSLMPEVRNEIPLQVYSTAHWKLTEAKR